MQRLCVLLPAFDEASSVGDVVTALRALALDGATLTPLVVDDGSRDDTAARARAAGAVVLRHERNRGVGAAFRTGVEWARAERFDALAHLDADGQLEPSELPRLWAPIARGEADLALGSRFLDGAAPPALAAWKVRALETAARTVGALTGYRLTDVSCGYRCMNARVLAVLRPTFDYDYIQETLLQALAMRARVVDVPVTAHYDGRHRGAGLSGQTFRYARRYVGLTAFALARFYLARVRA